MTQFRSDFSIFKIYYANLTLNIPYIILAIYIYRSKMKN